MERGREWEWCCMSRGVTRGSMMGERDGIDETCWIWHLWGLVSELF